MRGDKAFDRKADNAKEEFLNIVLGSMAREFPKFDWDTLEEEVVCDPYSDTRLICDMLKVRMVVLLEFQAVFFVGSIKIPSLVICTWNFNDRYATQVHAFREEGGKLEGTLGEVGFPQE